MIHKFSQSIIDAQKNILSGNVHFVRVKGKWFIEVHAVWNKKINRINIKVKQLALVQNFPYYKLYKAHFLTLLSYILAERSEAYSSKGEKSVFSETVLSSKATIALMKTKNPIIELKDTFMCFSGGIHSKDHESLSNIFILIEILLDDLDKIINNDFKMLR